MIGQATRLTRDTTTWPGNGRMVASGAPWQLMTTFNEWGEGTGVESYTQYPSSSGYGYYLDVLHTNGESTSGPTSTPVPSTTAVPTPTSPPTATVEPTLPPETSGFTVAAVGDIMHETSSTSFDRADQVCRLASQDDIFVALGDLQYETGTYELFMSRYDTLHLWRHQAQDEAGPRQPRVQLGRRRLLPVLRRACRGSSQGLLQLQCRGHAFHRHQLQLLQDHRWLRNERSAYKWLQADLAANPAGCTVAFWHHPRYSSGNHGDHPAMDPIWDLLSANGGDVVLSGHDHTYERFAPMDASGNVSSTGLREFVVGTGGKSYYAFSVTKPNSQVRIANVSGILRLNSDGTSYRWQFIGVDGTVYDEGTGSCVSATAATATAIPTLTRTATAAPGPTSTATPVSTDTPEPTSTSAPNGHTGARRDANGCTIRGANSRADGDCNRAIR